MVARGFLKRSWSKAYLFFIGLLSVLGGGWVRASIPRASEKTHAMKGDSMACALRGFLLVSIALAVSGGYLSSARAFVPECGPRAVQEYLDKLCDDIPWWAAPHIRLACESFALAAQAATGGVVDLVASQCCAAHDACYDRGGTAECKDQCDHTMYQCTADVVKEHFFTNMGSVWWAALFRWGAPTLADVGGEFTFNFNKDISCGLAPAGIAWVEQNLGINPLPIDRRLTTTTFKRLGESLGGWRLLASDELSPVTGDFDGDRIDDLAIRSGWGIGVISGASKQVIWGLPWGSQISRHYLTNVEGFGMYLRDLDGDGRAELVIRDGNGITVLNWNPNSSTVQLAHETLHGEFWGNWRVSHTDDILLFGDFNGDGRQDALIRSDWGVGIIGKVDSSYASLTAVPFGGKLASPPGLAALQVVSPDHVFAHAAPFRGKPSDEMLVQGPPGTGVAMVAYNPAAGALEITAGALYGEFMGNWRIAPGDVFMGTGDFNGDTYHDVIARSSWGIGVLMSDKHGNLSAPDYAMHAYYQRVGGWYLQPTDRFVAVTRDLIDRNGFSELILQSDWGLGVIEWNVERIIVYPDGTRVPVGGWAVAVASEQTGTQIEGSPNSWVVNRHDFAAATALWAGKTGLIFQRR